MNEPNLTPWFPHGTTPARDGVYEVVFVDVQGFAHFRAGSRWSALFPTADEAAEAPPAGPLKPRWRGLAEDPHAAFSALPAKVRADLAENADYLA
jgi:hypothetical protein